MPQNLNDERPVIMNQPQLMRRDGGYDTHLYISGVKSELFVPEHEMRNFTEALKTIARVMEYRLVIDTTLCQKEGERV